MLMSYRDTSGLNTALVAILSTLGLDSGIDINMDTSAGTATVTVEVSVDGKNWITVDTIAAAGSTQKHYGKDTVGAGKALAPLSFPLVRITAGAAGVGNSTTLTVSGN
jgi:hypothetical protein